MIAVRVQHFILNRLSQRHGSSPAWNLLGVEYRYTVPADTEFPRVIARHDVFVRFVVRGSGSARFVLRVWWLDAPEGKRRLVYVSRRHRVAFTAASTVLDHPFRIANFDLPGEGRYAIRLYRHRKPNWQGRREEPLRTEYFTVARAP